MVKFNTTILKFDEKGEKTGWTYIVIPASVAQKLKPNNKKSFRVKGRLDLYDISGIALLPMGEGDFIMALKADIRKNIKKQKGDRLAVELEVDTKELKPPAELMECLADEPRALAFFTSLAKSHQLYFGKWIEDAKTDTTKTKRIAQAVNALSKKQDYGSMIRSLNKDRDELSG